jgi:hypothetical protein
VSNVDRLSDGELRAQLQRRTVEESAETDWWREAFVGRVHAKMASTPPRAQSSRAPAAAGFLAAVAIVALLVFAFPRVSPSGGSPIPTTATFVATSSEAFPETAIASIAPAITPTPSTIASPAPGCAGTVKDETGLITACRRAGPKSADAAPVTVSNPNPDDLVLAVEWASVCEMAGRFTFRAAAEGYELIAESDWPTNSVCDGIPFAHVLELHLSTPINAEDVAVGIAHMALVCSPEPGQPFGDYATVSDETAVVEWCEGISAAGETDLPVLNPSGDLRVLQLNWTARRCDADPQVSVTRVGDAFTIHGVLLQKTCRSLPGDHSLLLHLRADVSADDVIALFDRHTAPTVAP